MCDGLLDVVGVGERVGGVWVAVRVLLKDGVQLGDSLMVGVGDSDWVGVGERV